MSFAKQDGGKWGISRSYKDQGPYCPVSFVGIITTVLPREAAHAAGPPPDTWAHTHDPGPSRPGQALATLGRQDWVGAGRGSVIAQLGWAPGTGLPWAPGPREPASCVQEPAGPKGGCRGRGRPDVGGMTGGRTRGQYTEAGPPFSAPGREKVSCTDTPEPGGNQSLLYRPGIP